VAGERIKFTCVAYDLAKGEWSYLPSPITETPPLLPQEFHGPELPIEWTATVKGNAMTACQKTKPTECISARLAQTWDAPPYVAVAEDHSAFVVLGHPADYQRHPNVADLYDGRTGRRLRALDAFPRTQRFWEWDLGTAFYVGNILMATWPTGPSFTESAWMFDAKAEHPEYLGERDPVLAPYKDDLVLVYPHGGNIVFVLDRVTRKRIATYPIGYRDPVDVPQLAHVGQDKFVLGFNRSVRRVADSGDEHHPDRAELLLLDIGAAHAGKPLVELAQNLPECDPSQCPACHPDEGGVTDAGSL
jgi:hypothetical protein